MNQADRVVGWVTTVPEASRQRTEARRRELDRASRLAR